MKSIAIAAVLFALTAGSAHAFTYDGRSNLNSDGSTKFTDPGEQLSDGTAKKKSKSGFSMSFSGGQTNPSFGGQNRFLPSSNRAFSSPFDQQSNFGSPGNN
jgi:hypothetical protein